MVTNQQLKVLFKCLEQGKPLTKAALRADMHPKTARKYRDLGITAAVKRAPVERYWVTRVNPFEEVWGEVVEMLEREPNVAPIAVMRCLQQRHPGRFRDTQKPTLCRHIRRWRTERAHSTKPKQPPADHRATTMDGPGDHHSTSPSTVEGHNRSPETTLGFKP